MDGVNISPSLIFPSFDPREEMDVSSPLPIDNNNESINRGISKSTVEGCTEQALEIGQQVEFQIETYYWRRGNDIHVHCLINSF